MNNLYKKEKDTNMRKKNYHLATDQQRQSGNHSALISEFY